MGFPSILPDNDMAYISLVLSKLEQVDNGCVVTVIKGLSKVIFDVLPSDFFRKKMIINEIQRIHMLMGLEPEFSKTLEYSPSVYFSLENR